MVQTVRIFLASPGDAQPAREAIAAAVRAVQAEPAHRETLKLDLLRWDHPDRPMPMSFLHNPQGDVNDYVADPATCHLLVALLRHSMGSPLPQQDPAFNYGLTPDGDPWSGTEWEIHRAVHHSQPPAEVWVYRDEANLVDDKSLPLKERQDRWQRNLQVDQFFEQCRAANGSWAKGYSTYADLSALTHQFSGQLREWLAARLASAAPPPRAKPPAKTARPRAAVQAETLTPAQQQLHSTLLACDEPLAAALVADVYAAPVRGLRGYLLQRVAAWCLAGRELDHRFVNLDLMLDHGAGSAGQRFEPQRFETLQALLHHDQGRTGGWVLVGDPGGGKSTVLQHHELRMARAGLRALATGQPLPELCLWQRLADMPPDTADPAAWLQACWQQQHPALPPLAQWAAQHRLRWLLDGLNEIKAPDSSAWRTAVGRWATWAAALLPAQSVAPIFTVRTLDYSATLSSPTLTVRQVRLARWSPQQVEQYCTARLGPANALWPAVEKDVALLDLCALPFNLDAQCQFTQALGRPASDRAELFAAMAWQRLRHAQARHELGHAGLLTERERAQVADDHYWHQHLHHLPAQGSLLQGLDRQASGMQAARLGAEVSVPEEHVAPWLSPADRGPWLAAVQALHMAEVELSGRFRFTHQLWQEFFAARGLRDAPLLQPQTLPDLASPPLQPLAFTLAGLAAQDPLPGPGVSAWEEVVVLALQLAAYQDQQAINGGAGVNAWLTHLRQTNLPLAGRAARGVQAHLQKTASGHTLLAALRAELLAHSRNAVLDLRLRIEAADALGELGCPRYQAGRGPEGHAYLVPTPEHEVPIPAGHYTLGSLDSDAHADEQPLTPVHLPAFHLAFAPVTNAEYRCFIDAGGYEDERWWHGETARRWRREGLRNQQSINDWTTWLAALREDFDAGVERYFSGVTEANKLELRTYARWSAEEAEANLQRQFGGQVQRQPEFWDDSRMQGALRPVVGVSLFEAQAYAAWLAAQTGRALKLPTEAQWEAAARGPQARRWPWAGPEPGPQQFNADPAHLRRTSPVGVFVQADTPECLTDMAGNVWEWTTSPYTEALDAQAVNSEAPEGLSRRVVRGGSWYFPSALARPAYRDRYAPGDRGDLGFRLCW